MARSSSRLLVQIILASEIGCPQQKPGGFFGPRRRREQSAIIAAQDVEPGTNISRVIVEMSGWATYPDSPAKNGGWGIKIIGSLQPHPKPQGSPEAGVGGENDRRGPLKRRAAPGGAKCNGAARRSRACGASWRA